MYWLVALCSGKGFYVVCNRVKLLCPINDMILRQDAGYSLVAGIGFHYCLEGSIELCEDRCGHKLFPQFVEGLLLLL